MARYVPRKGDLVELSFQRGHPFHVAIPQGLGVDGVVMADQVRSVDASPRGARRLGRAPDALVDEVLAILDAVIF